LGRQELSNDEHPSHIKTIANSARTFSLFFLWSHIDWPITVFLKNIEHFPIEAPFWTVNHKIETNSLPMAPPFQFIHETVELWANHMGQNWGAIQNVLGKTWGTRWEHTHREQAKKTPFHRPSPLT
jgi:hypothetical protein